MIKIGISSCFLYPDPNRSVFPPKTLNYLEKDMGQFLTRRGILPVLIPDLDVDLLADLVNEMDGFVFQGGTDVAPESYGELPIENGRWKGDRVRDVYELKLMKLAYDSGKPVFCICRGMQLMNVFFGGSLFQDTKTQRPETTLHRDATIYDLVSHPVTFTEGGLLHRMYGAAGEINSVHHQSINLLGKNLVVLAESPDHVIEAVGTRDSERWFVGVQWHPEFSHTLKGKVIDPEPLYSQFLTEVKRLKLAHTLR